MINISDIQFGHIWFIDNIYKKNITIKEQHCESCKNFELYCINYVIIIDIEKKTFRPLININEEITKIVLKSRLITPAFITKKFTYFMNKSHYKLNLPKWFNQTFNYKFNNGDIAQIIKNIVNIKRFKMDIVNDSINDLQTFKVKCHNENVVDTLFFINDIVNNIEIDINKIRNYINIFVFLHKKRDIKMFNNILPNDLLYIVRDYYGSYLNRSNIDLARHNSIKKLFYVFDNMTSNSKIKNSICDLLYDEMYNNNDAKCIII